MSEMLGENSIEQCEMFEVPVQPTSTSLADCYLDRTQRKIVQSYYTGPTKIIGAAGTGKTVVALHRAKLLAETGKSVLLCTFNVQLAARLRLQMNEVCPPQYRDRIRVAHVKDVALDVQKSLLAAGRIGKHRLGTESEVRRELLIVALEMDVIQPDELLCEWERFISPRAIRSFEEYQDLERSGAVKMTATARRLVWPVFEATHRRLTERKVMELHSLCRQLCEAEWSRSDVGLYDAVIVDECQDLCLFELRLLRLLCRDLSLLMVCGDPAQRIVAPPVRLPDAGIKCPGARTFVLTLGYRSTKQISELAESVLGQLELMWDGTERPPLVPRDDGEPPIVRRFSCGSDEVEFIAGEIQRLRELDPNIIVGLLLPTVAAGARFACALSRRGIKMHQVGSPAIFPKTERNLWQSYNSAKGMEFDVCFLPRLEWGSLSDGTLTSTASKSDAEHLRRLLHVVLSRARRRVYVSCIGQGVLEGAI